MSRSAYPSTLRAARVCSGLPLLVLLALALVPAPAAATQIAAAPLTSNLVEDQFPEVSAGQVAWLQGIGSDSEVRLFDGSSTVLVTDNGWMLDVDAHLSAGRLVWKNSVDFLSCSIERWSGGNQGTVDASVPCASEIRAAGPHTIWTENGTGGLDVFVRTDAGAPAQLGVDGVSESSPRVGDVAGTPRAAWLAPGGALWYWNGADAPVEVVASGASPPEMDGARMVWVASDGNDDEIFVYDGASTVPVTDNGYDDAEPQVSGSYVAWTGYPDTLAEGEIFVSDGVATLQLTDDDLDDRSPRVSTGLAGPSVAWIKDYGGENNVGDEIWMYEGCAAARVTDNAVADTAPALDGQLVAWVRGGGSESEIWAATVTCEGASAPVCGDGAVDAGEQCDDGGNAPGDGCDESCVDEICGNGMLQSGAGEACDDGNTADGDGCSAGCLVECGDGDVDAGEECDDSNATSGDGCSATCLAEICGNGRIDSGEQCDDGNSAEGDACGSSCAAAAPASPAHQRCINALNQLGARLTAAQHKVALECLDDAAEGNSADLGAPATAQACLANDPDHKVARGEKKTASCEAVKCDAGDPPDFAYTGAAAVNAAAEAEGVALMADLFGADLDAAVIAESTHKAGARCQQDVLKSTQELSNLLFKLAVKQKKKLLAGTDGSVVASTEALELGLLGYVQADARGRIGNKAAKLARTAAKSCRAVALDAAFPGCAPSADRAAVASCATSAARCRFCRALNAFDGLAMDCDDLDDGAANASCP
jgi:cysteine-rich repeat protein